MGIFENGDGQEEILSVNYHDHSARRSSKRTAQENFRKENPPVGAQGLRPEEIIGVAGNAIK
jgi:hypothetical protein